MTLPAPYYSRDGITIYCADCLAILPELPSGSVDMIWTDPPSTLALTSTPLCWDSWTKLRG